MKSHVPILLSAGQKISFCKAISEFKHLTVCIRDIHHHHLLRCQKIFPNRIHEEIVSKLKLRTICDWNNLDLLTLKHKGNYKGREIVLPLTCILGRTVLPKPPGGGWGQMD